MTRKKPHYFVSHKVELKVSDHCEHRWSLLGQQSLLSCEQIQIHEHKLTASVRSQGSFPLRCDEAIALSGMFSCNNKPSSGCSCRRVFAYSHQKLKAEKVTTLEAVRQPALQFTLFEHLLQFSVKNVLQKYCLHRTAVKISWTCKERGKKCANL